MTVDVKALEEYMYYHNKIKRDLPELEEILSDIQLLNGMATGRSDLDFCNLFLLEMYDLLINSILLFREGFFDCSFYSLRQVIEVSNSMLYLANCDSESLYKWNKKDWFPMNSKLVAKLGEMDEFYKEIKDEIPDFFKSQEDILSHAQKIIHKQGFDTFYSSHKVTNSKLETLLQKEESKFLALLKYTVGLVIISYIIVDPTSLILADDNVNMKFYYNIINDPANISFLNKYLSPSIIERIKNTKYYRDFSSCFEENEPMNEYTYDVMFNQFFSIEDLSKINKQRHILNSFETLILDLLLANLEFTKIYPDCCTLSYYFTSHKSNLHEISISWNSEEHNALLKHREEFNIPYKNIYRSIVKVLNDNWIFEHNEILSDKECLKIQSIIDEYKSDNAHLASISLSELIE